MMHSTGPVGGGLLHGEEPERARSDLANESLGVEIPAEAIEEYEFDPLVWDVGYVRRRIASWGNRNTVRRLALVVSCALAPTLRPKEAELV